MIQLKTIQLIKAIRDHSGMGLVDAKNLADDLALCRETWATCEHVAAALPRITRTALHEFADARDKAKRTAQALDRCYQRRTKLEKMEADATAEFDAVTSRLVS